MMRLPRLVSSSFPAAVVLGGVFGAATLLSSGTAEAGRAHFGGGVRFSGHVGVRGGASVHFARPFARPIWRPRVWVGGRVWWGGYYYPRPYYYYYYPEYVPSYYGGSYYPVQPQAGVAPGAVAVAAPPPPSMPTFGIGVFAGGTNVQDKQDSTDVGAMLRLRLTPGLLVEGELAKTSFKDNVRVDRRIGGSLIYEFGALNSLAPYVLAGGGVNQADVNGNFTTTQDFGELGVGLRWALSRNLHLTLDVRAGRRKTIDSNQPDGISNVVRTIAPPPGGTSNDTEDYTRGRLAAVLNF
jgi:hypothetical protein